MANDYTRQGQTFRATDVGSGKLAIIALIGEAQRTYDDTQSHTVTASATSLPNIPGASTHATVYCEGGSVGDFARYWEGADDPLQTVGKKLKDHEEILVYAPSSFRVIIGSGTPVLRIAYFHYA